MQPVDLRSDTVTRPTPAMLRAMANAAVGDDVYAEDPTVNQLQDLLAEMTGFEAGLFMPSGTMTNQAALAVHADRGTEVILPEGGHVYEFEPGSMAVISGLLPRIVPAPRGIPAAADVQAAVQRSIHQAPTGLIVLENTHNRAGGTVVPLVRCHEIGAVAQQEGLPFHLDGARAFNAAAALNVDIAEVCAPFDSVSICLSKGLAAPVGSVLLGSREFISAAHRYRKMLGGGMRQAGVLAAAGIVAVTEMTGRLSEDHERAAALARGLAELEGVTIDLASVQTNMVYLQVESAERISSGLAEQGVLCNTLGSRTIRLVTHYHVSDDDVTQTIERFRQVIGRPVPGA
jgi:threonine aldolase